MRGGAHLGGDAGDDERQGTRRLTQAELNAIIVEHNKWLMSHGANGTRADLTGLDVSWLDMSGRDLRQAVMVDAVMEGTNLTGSNLEGANLTGANLDKAILEYTCLNMSNLTDASLAAASLESTDLWGATTYGTDLRNTALAAESLEPSQLEDAILTDEDAADHEEEARLSRALRQARARRRASRAGGARQAPEQAARARREEGEPHSPAAATPTEGGNGGHAAPTEARGPEGPTDAPEGAPAAAPAPPAQAAAGTEAAESHEGQEGGVGAETAVEDVTEEGTIPSPTVDEGADAPARGEEAGVGETTVGETAVATATGTGEAEQEEGVPGGTEPGEAEPEGTEPEAAEPEGTEPGEAETVGTEPEAASPADDASEYRQDVTDDARGAEGQAPETVPGTAEEAPDTPGDAGDTGEGNAGGWIAERLAKLTALRESSNGRVTEEMLKELWVTLGDIETSEHFFTGTPDESERADALAYRTMYQTILAENEGQLMTAFRLALAERTARLDGPVPATQTYASATAKTVHQQFVRRVEPAFREIEKNLAGGTEQGRDTAVLSLLRVIMTMRNIDSQTGFGIFGVDNPTTVRAVNLFVRGMLEWEPTGEAGPQEGERAPEQEQEQEQEQETTEPEEQPEAGEPAAPEDTEARDDATGAEVTGAASGEETPEGDEPTEESAGTEAPVGGGSPETGAEEAPGTGAEETPVDEGPSEGEAWLDAQRSRIEALEAVTGNYSSPELDELYLSTIDYVEETGQGIDIMYGYAAYLYRTGEHDMAAYIRARARELHEEHFPEEAEAGEGAQPGQGEALTAGGAPEQAAASQEAQGGQTEQTEEEDGPGTGQEEGPEEVAQGGGEDLDELTDRLIDTMAEQLSGQGAEEETEAQGAETDAGEGAGTGQPEAQEGPAAETEGPEGEAGSALAEEATGGTALAEADAISFAEADHEALVRALRIAELMPTTYGERLSAEAAKAAIDLRAAPPEVRAAMNVRALQASGVPAHVLSAQHMASMALFSGWSGLEDLFRDDPAWLAAHPTWAELRVRLRDFSMGSSETSAAQAAAGMPSSSVPSSVARALWSTLETHGIGLGSIVVDVSAGDGALMMCAPEGVDMQGVESDPTTTAVVGHTSPDARIYNTSEEDVSIAHGSFDAVVSSIQSGTARQIRNGRSYALHNWLLLNGLDSLRPGGVLAVVVPSAAMDDASGTNARREMYRNAELLAALRVPGSHFAAHNGSDAPHDILILRKRQEPLALLPAEIDNESGWVRSVDLDDSGSVQVNALFADGRRVLGEQVAEPGPDGLRLVVRQEVSEADMEPAIADALEEQVSGAVGEGHDLSRDFGQPERPPQIVVRARQESFDYDYILGDDGNVYVGNTHDPQSQTIVEFTGVTEATARSRVARLKGMIALRDAYRTLRDAERDPNATDERIESLRDNLREEYQTFVQRYGQINNRTNRFVYTRESVSSAYEVLGLEEVDRSGNPTGRTADVLRTRAFFPEQPLPTHAETPEEALGLSLNFTGMVDIDYIADLLGTTPERATEALGDAVVTDPDTGQVVEAESYLTGDVIGRLEHVRELIDTEAHGARRAAEAAWHERNGLTAAGEALASTTFSEEAIAYMQGPRSRQRDNKEPDLSVWTTITHPRSHVVAEAPAYHYAKSGADESRLRSRHATMLAAYLRDADQDALEGFFDRTEDGRLSIHTTDPALVRALPVLYAVDRRGFEWSRFGDTSGSAATLMWLISTTKGAEELFEYCVQEMQANLSRSPWLASACDLAGIDASMPAAELTASLRNDPALIEYLAVRAAAWDEELGYMWNGAQRAVAIDRAMEGMPEALSLSSREIGRNPGLAGTLPGWATPEGLESFRQERAEALADVPPADFERIEELMALEERLEEALPPHVSIHDVSTRISSPWVTPGDILDFIQDEMLYDVGDNGEKVHRESPKLKVTKEAGVWKIWNPQAIVNNKNLNEAAPEAQADLGATRKWPHYNSNSIARWFLQDASALRMVDPLWILERALTGGEVRVTMNDCTEIEDPRTGDVRFEPKFDEEGHPIFVTDPDATNTVFQRISRIQDRFQKWYLRDPARADRAEREFNRIMAGMVERTYDGQGLTLPGSSPDVELRPWQKNLVRRFLGSTEGTLASHVVGAGKTMAAIASAHEAKRLGRARKPLVVVPNNLTDAWDAEWRRLYPTDRILVMDSVAMRHERRFWQAAANGDWDGIIVPHSRFDDMSLSEEVMEDLKGRRLEEVRQATAEAQEQREGQRPNRRVGISAARLDKVYKTSEKSNRFGVYLDQVGFDMLVLDEAHTYKNLAIPTTMQVPGATTAQSNKSERMLMFCEWLHDRGCGSNLLFLTGTPITNTPSEIYNMMRYLCPDQLNRMGCRHFVDWAAAFEKIGYALEILPEGKGFHMKERVQMLDNLPLFLAQASAFMDRINAEDINLPLPAANRISEDVAPSPTQLAMAEWLSQRGRAIRKGTVDRREDNMLLITGEAQKISLDPKLFAPADPDVPDLGRGGKIGACAANVMREYEDNADRLGCQVVFCDSSTASGKNGGTWNAQEKLRSLLVEQGIPAEQVACMADAGDDAAKREALYGKVRDGQVRVLIGSTTTCGTGANLQDRLCAVHHLDLPQTAAGIEQREGRAIRQGNMFESVNIYTYPVTGTYDAQLAQQLARKARAMAQLFNANAAAPEGVDVSDLVLTLEDLKARAAGDPRVRERLELMAKKTELESDKAAFMSQKAVQRERHERALAEAGRVEGELAKYGTAVEDAAAAAGWLDQTKITKAAQEKLERHERALERAAEREGQRSEALDVEKAARLTPIPVSVVAGDSPARQLAHQLADGWLAERSLHAARMFDDGRPEDALNLMRRTFKLLAKRAKDTEDAEPLRHGAADADGRTVTGEACEVYARIAQTCEAAGVKGAERSFTEQLTALGEQQLAETLGAQAKEAPAGALAPRAEAAVGMWSDRSLELARAGAVAAELPGMEGSTFDPEALYEAMSARAERTGLGTAAVERMEQELGYEPDRRKAGLDEEELAETKLQASGPTWEMTFLKNGEATAVTSKPEACQLLMNAGATAPVNEWVKVASYQGFDIEVTRMHTGTNLLDSGTAAYLSVTHPDGGRWLPAGPIPQATTSGQTAVRDIERILGSTIPNTYAKLNKELAAHREAAATNSHGLDREWPGEEELTRVEDRLAELPVPGEDDDTPPAVVITRPLVMEMLMDPELTDDVVRQIEEAEREAAERARAEQERLDAEAAERARRQAEQAQPAATIGVLPAGTVVGEAGEAPDDGEPTYELPGEDAGAGDLASIMNEMLNRIQNGQTTPSDDDDEDPR